MPYTLELNQENLGTGSIQITGLGTLDNGKKYVISDEAADMFEVLQGVSLLEADIYGVKITEIEETGGGN